MAVTTRKKKAKEFDAASEAQTLTAMTKDGQTIKVCAAQVKHHQALGWNPEK